MRRLPAGLALILLTAGCAYYNAMWSAERFASEARRLEQRGDASQARSQWSRAALKAESVLVRHPRSRWADDALVLRAEGLARSGACATAAAPIAKARATVSEPSLLERAGLAAAECALAGDRPVEAERALEASLRSNDADHRSRAEYLAGLAAEARLEFASAADHFRRSRERPATAGRIRVLLAAERMTEAAQALTDAGEALDEADRAAALARLDLTTSATTLDRLLRGRLPFAEQARLLIAHGDRRLAAGDFAGATARYEQAGRVAPAAAEAGQARVRQLRVVAVQTTTPEELRLVHEQVAALARPQSGGVAVPAARELLDLLSQLVARPETQAGEFRQAELARDALGSPWLAGRMFLDLAAADPASLFAPKALVSALALLPERRDSILALLETSYAESPYTRALRGEASPAYAAAEDSLARALGVQVARVTPTRGMAGRVEAPGVGPRGPWLDPLPPPPAAPALRPRPGRPVVPNQQ